MKNIIKLFLADVKRLSSNVVAVVVIIGLTVLPSLYAWFNILSNWDPYGPDATTNLQVAVATADKGMSVKSYTINVGNLIISNLKENDTIGWVFTDTVEEAVNGVTSGAYYACLIVDESFSEDLMSFLGGTVKQPVIRYYENEKKNAIAPKITAKVKTTVQRSVNSAFVSTLTNYAITAGDYVITSDESHKLSDKVASEMSILTDNLENYIVLIDSYISMIEASEGIVVSTGDLSKQVENAIAMGNTTLDALEQTLTTAENGVSTMNTVMVTTLDRIYNGLGDAYDAVDALMKGTNKSVDTVKAQIAKMQTATDTMETTLSADNVKSALEGVDKNTADTLYKDIDQLQADLAAAQKYCDKTKKASTTLMNSIKTDIEKCQKDVKDLKVMYTDQVTPALNASIDATREALNQCRKVLDSVDQGSIDAIILAVEGYPDIIKESTETLTKVRDTLLEIQGKADEIVKGLNGTSEVSSMASLISLLEKDPEYIAEFISSPVKLDTEEIYPVANNGSAAAPFYIVLSIWFGSLMMSVILKTNIKDRPEVKGAKNWQKFFGRYITTFLIGQIQTLITVMGALWYIKIQCLHPELLLLAALLCSFVFSLLLYSFTYSFGNVGEALSVILMVIQVAGSGGTFPVEVLPKVFQYMYNYMPFMYGMNAMRECIAGRYMNDYGRYLAGLAIYFGVALVVGLLLYFPAKKLIDLMEESKEKTDLLI